MERATSKPKKKQVIQRKTRQLNKQIPKFKNIPPPAKDSLAKEASLKQLSDNTLLITLPSFEWDEKKK